ncbi:MAG: flavodoxin family protein [Leptotrichiaceae bacterium]|nr:flavodoxin family protein [Leptotrichiaceae bacterium]
MEIIITDLNKEKFQKIYENIIKKNCISTLKKIPKQTNEITVSNNQIILIHSDSKIKSCMGCFECWVKTPGKCKIRDGYENLAKIYSKAEKIIIISKCCYGSYSPFVKNILDRSIPYLLPFFKFKNKEMHHLTRYRTKFDLNVCFYGENLTKSEKETAEKLVKANCINLNVKKFNIDFFGNDEGEHQI